MKPTIFLSLLLAFVFMAVPGCTNKKKEEPKKPNLVYVFPDQLRKQAMAFWDTPEFKGAIRTKADPVITPNIDKLAHEAVVITRAVSNFPLCSPHRGSLMTGMYPGSSGVPLNCNATRPISSLRTDLTGFSDVLKKGGYALGYIGKWHLDYPLSNDPANPGNYVDPREPAWDAYTPAERRHGFDYWYSYGTWDVHKDPHYYDTEGNRYEPKEYSPKHEADKAIAYLKNDAGQRDSNKPFALFVSMNPPHSPYSSLDDAMEEDYNLYKDMPINELLHRDNAVPSMDKAHSAAYYFANVTGVDREFGRIVQQLKDMGEYDNTILVFTSDHGETMTSQGITEPKNNIYTEAFDVPFIVRLPGMETFRTEDLIMSSPDIMPTILGLMGLSKDVPSNVQGFDYSEAIKGNKDAKRPSSALYIRNLNGEKNEESMVISYFPEARGVKNQQYSLEFTINRNNEITSTKFFDDNADPYQLNNLPVKKDDPVVQGLLKEMAYWLKHSDDKWYEEKILDDWISY